jgi:hypothetical protein
MVCLSLAALSALFLATSYASSLASKKQPNILFMLTDDQDW